MVKFVTLLMVLLKASDFSFHDAIHNLNGPAKFDGHLGNSLTLTSRLGLNKVEKKVHLPFYLLKHN